MRASLVRAYEGEEEVVDAFDLTGPGSCTFTVPGDHDGTLHLTISGWSVDPYEGTMAFTERYFGEHSGSERVHGKFLVSDDVCVPAGTTLNLEKYVFGNQAEFVIAESASGQSWGYSAGECEFVVKGGGTLNATGIQFCGESSYSGGIYGTFSLPENSAVVHLDGCSIYGGHHGISSTASCQVTITNSSSFSGCQGSAIKWQGTGAVVSTGTGWTNCDIGIQMIGAGSKSLHVTGGTFSGCGEGIYLLGYPQVVATVTSAEFDDCPWGIRAETTTDGTNINVTSSIFSSTNVSGVRHIEVVGSGCLDVGESCHFEHHHPSMGYGVIFRGSTRGDVSDCFFEAGPFANSVAYHGVECRTNNDEIDITGCCFTGQGGFSCNPAIALNNYGVFVFGNIDTNRPRLRSNVVQQYWHGVGAEQAVPDLGLEEDQGQNEFYENCCDVRYGGMTAEPPQMMPAYGNCWDGSTTPSSDDICGNWADFVGTYPGYCGLGKGAPALIPASLGLRVEGPNPFSEVAGIALDLPEQPTGDVSVEVVDMAGRVVKQFSLKDPGAGTYRFAWDGRGVDGSAVPSGVYVCRARVSGKLLTDRIVYLKNDLDQE